MDLKARFEREQAKGDAISQQLAALERQREAMRAELHRVEGRMELLMEMDPSLGQPAGAEAPVLPPPGPAGTAAEDVAHEEACDACQDREAPQSPPAPSGDMLSTPPPMAEGASGVITQQGVAA